jgi:DNA polymerase
VKSVCSDPLEVPILLEVLEMRRDVSKSSVKKYKSVLEGLDEDAHIRGAFQYNGAGRTWRWSGRRFQPHNLARPEGYLESSQEKMSEDLAVISDLHTLELFYDSAIDMLSSSVRTVVQPEDGYVILDADLNAIENRVLGWVAREDKILQVFRDGRCPYIDFATYMFHQPYDELYAEYKAGNKGKRQIAKPGVLGGGYMLGVGYEYEDVRTGEMNATGLLGYAWGMGIAMTKEEAQLSIDAFRGTYTRVVEHWYEMENAAKKCLTTGQDVRAGFVEFRMRNPFLQMVLPSGRALHYLRPRLEQKMMPWGKEKKVITYEGYDDKRKWTRITSSPGKWVENEVQAIARDILVEGLLEADRRGLDIFMHVHDQICVHHPVRFAECGLRNLIECMEKPLSWAPDLPLKAEGGIFKCFQKD